MTQAIQQYAEFLSNGYLSIPKAITRRLHLKQGIKFKVIEDKGTIVLKQIEDDWKDFGNILIDRNHSKTVKQLAAKVKEKYPDISLDLNLLKFVGTEEEISLEEEKIQIRRYYYSKQKTL